MDHRSALTEWPFGEGGMAGHRELLESWAQAVWETDPHGVVIADSPSWRAYTGQTLQEWLGYGWLDAIHPDDRAYAERQWREATAAHGLVNAEFRLLDPNGGWRWTNVRAAPVLDAKGEIEKWAGMNIDIDARKRAEAALRDNEERQTFQLQLSDALASLSDPADIEAAAARLVAGQLGVSWCYFNEFDDRGTHAIVLGDFRRDGLASMVGIHDLSGERDFLDLMCSDAMLDMPDLTCSELFSAQAKATYGASGIRSALGAPLLRSGRLAAVLLVADTSVRQWARGDSELLRGVAERTWAAIQRARAHAALNESERRQRLLLGELQHRVRNILAMIQSVVRRTLNTDESAEEYASHLEGRIAAMARTQAALTRSTNREVDLEEAVSDELLSVIASEKQFWCEGPDVALAPKAAEILTLAIHELATNSMKYGAFSGSEGQVEIRWTVQERDARQWLAFEWEETRVPHAGFHREGFGTELITRRVPYELGGKGSLTPTNDGMLATIEFPLKSISSILETDMPEHAQ